MDPESPSPQSQNENADSEQEVRRSRSKISKLPSEVRERINQLLYEGLTYARVLEELGDAGSGRQICWEAGKTFPCRFFPVNFPSKKDDLGFALMNQLSAAEKRFPQSENDIAADYFTLRRNFIGKNWVFSEGSNQFNHCDIAWAGALATHAHLTNKPVLTARLG